MFASSDDTPRHRDRTDAQEKKLKSGLNSTEISQTNEKVIRETSLNCIVDEDVVECEYSPIIISSPMKEVRLRGNEDSSYEDVSDVDMAPEEFLPESSAICSPSRMVGKKTASTPVCSFLFHDGQTSGRPNPTSGQDDSIAARSLYPSYLADLSDITDSDSCADQRVVPLSCGYVQKASVDQIPVSTVIINPVVTHSVPSRLSLAQTDPRLSLDLGLVEAPKQAFGHILSSNSYTTSGLSIGSGLPLNSGQTYNLGTTVNPPGLSLKPSLTFNGSHFDPLPVELRSSLAHLSHESISDYEIGDIDDLSLDPNSSHVQLNWSFDRSPDDISGNQLTNAVEVEDGNTYNNYETGNFENMPNCNNNNPYDSHPPNYFECAKSFDNNWTANGEIVTGEPAFDHIAGEQPESVAPYDLSLDYAGLSLDYGLSCDQTSPLVNHFDPLSVELRNSLAQLDLESEPRPVLTLIVLSRMQV